MGGFHKRRSARERRHRSRNRRRIAIVVGLIVSLLVGLDLMTTFGPKVFALVALNLDPDRRAIRDALADPAMSNLRAGYIARGYHPIWLHGGRFGGDAALLVRTLSSARQDDLDPAQYGASSLERKLKSAEAPVADRTRTELLLTRAYVNYVGDLHRPLPDARMVYTDAALAPPTPPVPKALIVQLSQSRSPAAALSAATRMNPLYTRLRGAIEADGHADVIVRRQTLLNLERLRALPITLGSRFLLVDAASAQLWMYEDGRPVDSMKVIVGKPDEATPIMAGVIRYALFNPYWNVPPDLVRNIYAPRLRADPSVLGRLGMQVVSDYTADAKRLDPATVDWSLVARGAVVVGLRQQPGPHNSMGAVKFMLPNELGIYLHDTPNKALFEKPVRTLSAGCVRVEDYRRLALWLYRGAQVGARGDRPDQLFVLPAPVPVYITYLTMRLDGAGEVAAPDGYHRDKNLLSQLQSRGRSLAPLRSSPS